MVSLVSFLTDIPMAFPYVKAFLREEGKFRVLRVDLAVVDAEVKEPLRPFFS